MTSAKAAAASRKTAEDENWCYGTSAHKEGDRLVCDECGKVEPFSDPGLEHALEEAALRLAYGMRAHDVVLHGNCGDCSPTEERGAV